MAGALLTPRWRAVDNNGAPISGAKLYFFQAGTTTPVTTYSEKALSSAQANPLVADGNGFFAPSFIDDASSYKVRYTDASDNQFWEDDNVNTYQLGGSSLATRFLQAASNPLDYGAVGDGVADESTEVQAAIDGATRVVDLLGKTYRCDSTINLASGITFKNGSLDFTNCTDNAYLSASGSLANQVNMTGTELQGDQSIAVSSISGYSAGDLIFLNGNATLASGVETGELQTIYSASGSSLFLNESVVLAYSSATPDTVHRVNAVKDLNIFDVYLTCSSSASGDGVAILLENCRNVKIRNIGVDSPKASGLRVLGSYNVRVDGLHVQNGSSSSVGLEVSQYSKRFRASHVVCENVGVGMSVGDPAIGDADGLTYDISVSESEFYSSTTGASAYTVELLKAASKIKLSNCFFDPPGTFSNGVICEASDVLIDGCSFGYNCTDGVRIDDGITYSGFDKNPIHVTRCRFDGITKAIDTAASFTNSPDLIFDHNKLYDCAYAASSPVVDPDDSFNSVSVQFNLFHTTTTSDIVAISTAANNTSYIGNKFIGTWHKCMVVQGYRGCCLANTANITSSGSVGIEFDTGGSPTDFLVGLNNMSITGSGATGQFMTITESASGSGGPDRISMIGNIGEASGSPAVSLSNNLDRVVFVGNNIKSLNTTNPTLSIPGDAVQTLDGLNVLGNVLETGGATYVVSVTAANVSNDIVAMNVLLGGATGGLTGTVDESTGNVT